MKKETTCHGRQQILPFGNRSRWGKGFQTICHLILDDRQRVWVAALKEKIFPLPGCQQTCLRPEKPGSREFLDLDGLGRILGVSLPPAFYSPVSTGVRSGFFHHQKRGWLEFQRLGSDRWRYGLGQEETTPFSRKKIDESEEMSKEHCARLMVGCLGLVLGNGAVGSQREEADFARVRVFALSKNSQAPLSPHLSSISGSASLFTSRSSRKASTWLRNWQRRVKSS